MRLALALHQTVAEIEAQPLADNAKVLEVLRHDQAMAEMAAKRRRRR